jgi:hypothetical protein
LLSSSIRRRRKKKTGRPSSVSNSNERARREGMPFLGAFWRNLLKSGKDLILRSW